MKNIQLKCFVFAASAYIFRYDTDPWISIVLKAFAVVMYDDKSSFLFISFHCFCFRSQSLFLFYIIRPNNATTTKLFILFYRIKCVFGRRHLCDILISLIFYCCATISIIISFSFIFFFTLLLFFRFSPWNWCMNCFFLCVFRIW